MGFLYVQTWTVSKGKFEEHDELVKKMRRDLPSVFGMRGRVFLQRYGPLGARVLIMEYKDDDEFRSFFDKFNKNEKAVKLRSKWRELIDTASWRAVFWNEIARE